MGDTDDTVTRERAGRLTVLATEMDVIVRDIGPKMIRLAHLRREVRTILGELGRDPEQKP